METFTEIKSGHWRVDLGDEQVGIVCAPTEDAARQAYTSASNGWVPNIDDLRIKRDQLLAESDWTQVADAPTDKAAWATYRQQLRDLPANTSDFSNPAWPEPPQ